MMMPDIRTLMLLYIIINVISAGAVAVIWSQNRGRFAGISFWLVDMILQAAGSALIVLRGLAPDFASMVLANAMVQAGALIIFIGLERFTGKKSWQIHNYVLLAVFIAIITYYSLVQPDLTAREIALSAMTMILTFQCCWLLLRRVDPGMSQVTRITGIIFACYAAFSFARIILQIIFPGRTNDFFKSGAVDALAITVYIVLSVCLTISLVLMVNRRLLVDVKTREEALRESEGKHRAVVETASDVIVIVQDGIIRFSNPRVATMFGYETGEIEGMEFASYISQENLMLVLERYRKRMAGEKLSEIYETALLHKSGKKIPVEMNGSVIQYDGKPADLAIIRDITERKLAEEALAKSEERYRTILENMLDSYIEVDLSGNFIFVNEAACRNLGYDMEELIGQSFGKIAPGEDEVKAIFKAYNEVYKTGEPHTGFAFKVMRKDESTGYAETSISLIKNEQGRPIGFRSVGRDVTERKQLEQKLVEMATHDALTGLPNRTLLFDRCNMALANAQRNNKMVVIISLDLDLFKNVNDTLGHDMGDRLLTAAAGRLIGALRKSDTVARVGGDEFVLLLWEVDDKDAAVIVAEKILEDFRQPFLIDGHSLIVTVSIGIATYPEDGANMEDLLRNSDKSMYTAKQNGGDRFVI
jgi:diguanylate cyclase (GGDEF)-like protein/PAS domain S-box-containing protein